VRVAARHRDDGRPDAARALVRAQAAGEQPVAVGDLHDVVRARARGGERARHQFRPDVDVALRVAGDDRLPGRPGRALYAHDLGKRRGEQPVGILVAQVGLFGEGQEFQVLDAPDVLGLDPLRVHPGAVDRHVVVLAAYHLL